MDDVHFDELSFTVGYCDICDREVLTYAEYDDGGAERRQCVHCEQPARRLRRTTGAELPGHGYGLLETQGCGNPACGGGQCSRRQNDA
jgi:hypothetical protein